MSQTLLTLRTRVIDIDDGQQLVALIHSHDANLFGITSRDMVTIVHDGHEYALDVDITNHLVEIGEIGLFADAAHKYNIPTGIPVGVFATPQDNLALDAIRKKLLGKKLTEPEVKAIIDGLANNTLSDILVTYYAATSFFYHSDADEMVRATKYSAQTGDTIDWKTREPIAVKYSIGGVPGNETSMIIVPVLASLGITIPKTFSTSITSPAATGECVSVLMNTKLSTSEIKQITLDHHGCLALGSSLRLAPANDRIINVSHPLSMEPYTKMVISIMAKQYAMGATHLLIDVPVGPTAKITDPKIARRVKGHFEYIGAKLGIKTQVELTKATQPIGWGVGASLQVREVIRILQQLPDRSPDLESKAISLWAKLISLVKNIPLTESKKLFKTQLKTWAARRKLQEIMTAQWPGEHSLVHKIDITPQDIPVWAYFREIGAPQTGTLESIDLRYLNTIARTLGCPVELQAWLQLHQRIGDTVTKWSLLMTLYANESYKLDQAIKLLTEKSLYRIAS